MKSLKKIALIACSLLFFAAANASALDLNNGISAGKAMYSLYKQYKADGKLDLSNATNISNIITLVNNVKGLTSKSTVSNTPASFISGLLSGSQNLVTNSNTNTVLSSLASIANVDTSSLAGTATKAVATSAVNKLLSKSSTSSNSDSNSSASIVNSVLTNLFSSL